MWEGLAEQRKLYSERPSAKSEEIEMKKDENKRRRSGRSRRRSRRKKEGEVKTWSSNQAVSQSGRTP